jgi:regulator of replication initiation timing
MRHLNWIISVLVAAGTFGSGEIKNSEKKELVVMNDSLANVNKSLVESLELAQEDISKLVSKNNELVLANDSLESVLAIPKTEKKCPDCPTIPKKIHPFSKGVAFYDSTRKSPRQPIGIEENEFELADTAVDIIRSHPHPKIKLSE